jgi:hypothetical protein
VKEENDEEIVGKLKHKSKKNKKTENKRNEET